MSEVSAPDGRPTPRRLQFSLRALLLGMTFVALGVGLWTAVPWLLLVLGIILVLGVLPTALVVLVVYARGMPRTFAIGALVPLIVGLLPMEAYLPSTMIFAPLASLLGGLLAVWLRRRIRDWGWDDADR